jgi:pimeloyl-ACP methyl ester carboxylesterase
MSGALPTVVLAHGGVGHGPWQWRKVISELFGLGVPVTTHDRRTPTADGWVDRHNPSAPSAPRRTFHALLDAIPGQKILVGHSGGGFAISDAGAGRQDVAHLVYVTAFMGGDGIPLRRSARSGEDIMGMSLDEVRAVAAGLWYQDCAAEDVEWAVGQLVPWVPSAKGAQEPKPGAAWKEIPSTFIVTTMDRALDPDAQRAQAKQATNTIEIETGHSPFMSKPVELARMLAEIAEEYSM